jgi:hypothetical protein
MRNLSNTNVTFVIRALARKKVLKGMYNICMKTSDLSIVICAVILLSSLRTLDNTLNVFMRNLSNTNVKFVIRALAEKKILKSMYNLCMKTSNLSNVICASIQLSFIETLKST